MFVIRGIEKMKELEFSPVEGYTDDEVKEAIKASQSIHFTKLPERMKPILGALMGRKEKTSTPRRFRQLKSKLVDIMEDMLSETDPDKLSKNVSIVLPYLMARKVTKGNGTKRGKKFSVNVIDKSQEN